MRKSCRLIFTSLLIGLVVLGGASCTRKARKAKFMSLADKDFAAGNYDQAEIEYINALRLDPTTARAYGQLGIMSFEQGRLARAYPLLRRALQLDPNNLDYHLEMGLFYAVAGKLKESGEEASYVLAHRPEDEEAPLMLADVALTSKDVEAARQRLQNLVLPPNKRAAVEAALGSIYARGHDFKAAEAAYERSRQADPKYGPLYAALGSYYWSQNDLKKADEAFKTSADLAPARSPRRLRYAQFKMQNGDLAAGKAILEATLSKAPDYNPAAMLLAEVAAGEKKYDDANKLLSGVLARDPQSYDAMLLNGRVALAQGDTARALSEFDNMLKIYPKSPQILYQQALAYSAGNDTAKAVTSLEQAITLNPGYAEAVLALAQLKISKGDLSAAIISLRQFAAQHPQSAQAELLLAEAYRQQGNLDEALNVYARLEKDYPKNAQTHLFKGMILIQQNKRPEARVEFAKSLELYPGYPAALEHLTDMDVDDGQYSKALQRVEKVIAADPKAPEPTLLLAKIYLAQKDRPKAEAVLLKTVQEYPDFDGGYLMMGRLYDDSNQSQKALDIMYKLLGKNAQEPGAWMVVATIKDAQKEYDTARDAYEKVLALDPRNSAALNNLAYLYAEHQQVDKGYELARRARELLPYDPSGADTLGWILFKKGEYRQAVSLLQESVKKLPVAPDVDLHLGMAYYMAGEEESARPFLQIGVKSTNDFSGKEEARQCLAILAVDVKTAGSEARAALEKRMAEQPGDLVAVSRLAAIYQREGNPDKAISAYESALKANPANVRGFLELAELYESQPGQTGKAFAMAKTAYKLAPEDAKVGRVLGRLAFLEGDYPWSLNLLQEAAQRRSGDPELLCDLAEAAYSCGQVSDAQTDMRGALAAPGFSRADAAKKFLDMVALASDPRQAAASVSRVEQTLKSNPNYVPALMALATVEEQKGEVPAAMQTYEKVLNLYSDFVPAKRRLAIIYAQRPGDDQKAYAVAIKAREAYPEDREVGKALGIILYRQKDYVRAAQVLTEIASQAGGDGQLCYYLGMAQYHLSQSAESKKNLLRATQLKLPDNLLGEAKRVLAELK